MTSKRLFLLFGVLSVGLFGAYWVVRAQDARPLFKPPAVLPKEGASKKPDEKKGNPDPSLIIPPEVYDVPRPLLPADVSKPLIEPGRGIVVDEDAAASGADKKPLIPEPSPLPLPLPGLDTKPLDKVPAPLPMVDPIPLPKMDNIPPPMATPVVDKVLPPFPTPEVDPTKVLITDLQPKEIPKQAAPPEMKFPQIELPPMDKPKTATPLPVPQVDKPKTATPLPVPQVEQPLVNRPKSFIRIRSGGADTPPPITPPPGPIGSQYVPPLGPSPLVRSETNPGGALMSLQTPAVGVDKRRPTQLLAGKAESYQIVVRNLGVLHAQQIRIEDEIPAGVRIVSAEPTPVMQGAKAIWTLPALAPNNDHTIRLTLEASSATTLASSTTLHVAASTQIKTTVLRPHTGGDAFSIDVRTPPSIVVGKPAVFEIRVENRSERPLTNIVLFGFLPPGLTTPDGPTIEGDVDGSIAPGQFKILRMPTTAVKTGRHTLTVKVATQAGEMSTTANIDIAGEGLLLQQPPQTRLVAGREGDLRIDIANHTGKPLKNVQVAGRLAQGLDFIAAGERGLFQANSRTVHWLIDQLPVGKTVTLPVRVHAMKPGPLQNLVYAKADGVPEMQSAGTIVVVSFTDLTLKVTPRDNPLEIGSETVYEVQVANPSTGSANNVQLQVQFPPGMTPKNAEGKSRFTIDRNTMLFEPVATLGSRGQLTYRVIAQANALGDQRVRFALTSGELAVPIQREISTNVVPR